MTKTTKSKIRAMYLDYVNNFLTVACFAEYYGISRDVALDVISFGRKLK